MATTLDDVINRQTYSPVTWLLSRQTFWVFVATIIACLALAVVSTPFSSPQNLFSITRNFSFTAIAALGMTAVIITGGIDLSVGSVMGLSAMTLGLVMGAGHSVEVGILAGLAVSLAVGFAHGFLIAYVNMPSFVVTLATLSIWRSQGQVWSNNAGVYKFGPDQADFFWLGGGSVYGIANPVIALVILTAVTGFCLRWTRWGCHLFAIGGNEKAARLTGVPVRRIKLSAYVFCSLMAGIAGMLMAGWLGSVTQNHAEGKELSVIAATVIGGANLMGGSGTAIGGVVGAALIEIIRNSLTMLGINTFWQGTFIGGCILIAVALDRAKALRQTEE